MTEIQTIPNRGHSLTIDSGWREVAQVALDFVKRFTHVGGRIRGPIGRDLEAPAATRG